MQMFFPLLANNSGAPWVGIVHRKLEYWGVAAV